jgi:hypothetical protein
MIKCIEDFGTEKLDHPLEDVDYRRTMQKVPKKPFRSPLNSMACHDSNIKNLVLRTRVYLDHPDKGIHKQYKNKSGNMVDYFDLHPPLALAPPTTLPVYHLEKALPAQPMDRKTRQKLIRTAGLAPKQKFVIEQVDHGRTMLMELEKFLNVSRSDNFKTRIIKPLIEKGLLLSFQSEVHGEHYHKPEDFEQALDKEFEKSRSQEQCEETAEKIEAERQAYQSKLEMWNDDTRLRKTLEEFFPDLSGRKVNDESSPNRDSPPISPDQEPDSWAP